MRGKTLKNLVLAVGLGLATLTGCDQYNTNYSKHDTGYHKIKTEKKTEYELKTESAIVSEKYHRGMYMYPMRVGKMTTFQTIPAVNKISFDGEMDFQVNNKTLFDRFHEKDSVIVSYTVIYRSKYGDKNNDGIKDLISREFKGYEFVDAIQK
jgi:hypothetical protein